MCPEKEISSTLCYLTGTKQKIQNPRKQYRSIIKVSFVRPSTDLCFGMINWLWRSQCISGRTWIKSIRDIQPHIWLVQTAWKNVKSCQLQRRLRYIPIPKTFLPKVHSSSPIEALLIRDLYKKANSPLITRTVGKKNDTSPFFWGSIWHPSYVLATTFASFLDLKHRKFPSIQDTIQLFIPRYFIWWNTLHFTQVLSETTYWRFEGHLCLLHKNYCLWLRKRNHFKQNLKWKEIAKKILPVWLE